MCCCWWNRFKVRPISKKDSEGYLRVGVETYGGGLWHSVCGDVLSVSDLKLGAWMLRSDGIVPCAVAR